MRTLVLPEAMKASLACLIFLAPLVAGCGGDHEPEEGGAVFPQRHTAEMPSMPANAVVLEAPPFKNPDTEDCSDCHDPDFMEVDRTVRIVEGDHEEMTPFAHAVGRIWCFDCHDGDDRDMLRLANGELIEFEDTPRLCGQCHGDTHREWIAGVHGKRTGSWVGEQDRATFADAEVKDVEYRVCSVCHDPHAPLFEPLVPEAAPKRPELNK